MTPGTYFVKCEDRWTFSGAPDGRLTVAAGVFRHPDASAVEEELMLGDRYALWEKATDTHAEPEEGRIGVAVVMPGAEVVRISDDGAHGLCTRSVASGDTLTYWFGSCWSKAALKTPQAWFSQVRDL